MGRAVLLKVFGMGVLAAILLIPVMMIRDLIVERQARRAEAVSEIAAGWGGRQLVAGPVLVTSYRRTWNEVVREMEDGKPKERRTERSESGVVRIPIDAIEWSVQLATSEKARGIHKARLYLATIGASGRVTIPANFGKSDPQSKFEWGETRLVVGIADPRGIRKVAPLAFGGRRVEFAPGTGNDTLEHGVQATLGHIDAGETRSYSLSFGLDLAGAEAFAVSPLARNTAVALRADWPHPSFFGPYLPASHTIENASFAASWRVSEFAAQGADRLASCANTNKGCPQATAEVLGVSLIEPVGVYQQLDRASKYGFLFIGLLFAAFFMFELLKRLAIHPIQYGLVGLALALFFLLITALSEHMAFGWAYLIATTACVGLVTFYLIRVLQSTGRGYGFGIGLALLYGALYMLLNAEDYALVAGAVLLFALLAALMAATRGVDWYRLTRATAH